MKIQCTMTCGECNENDLNPTDEIAVQDEGKGWWAEFQDNSSYSIKNFKSV